jgi:hypothetical protein
MFARPASKCDADGALPRSVVDTETRFSATIVLNRRLEESMKFLGLLLFSLALPLASSAETFKVFPGGTGGYPTIEAAIWASSDGDTILLGDGLYTGDGNRDLFNGSRWILIRSQSGDPELCVIDCQGGPAEPHAGIWLDITGSKAPHPKTAFGLDGITITGAYAHSGAAVKISDGAAPWIHRCHFIDNVAEYEGGAVASNESGGTFEDCLFLRNQAPSGVAMHLGPYFFLDAIGCTFAENSADEGGAVLCRMSSYHMNFVNCTFAGNEAPAGCNLCLEEASVAVLDNCILAFGGIGAALVCESASSAVLSCCDIFGNEGGDWAGCIADQLGVNGNIAEDPLFCDPLATNYRLAEDSPCAPFTLPNVDCDQIGAWPIGCGPTETIPRTWGGIKALYRD